MHKQGANAMKLINSQKNNTSKKHEQEQYPKVKTFSRAYAFSPAQSESASDKSVSASPFRPDERPYPLASPSFIPSAPELNTDESERIDLQDTLLTDESFVERHPKSHSAADDVSAAESADKMEAEESEDYIEAPHYYPPVVKDVGTDETDEPDEDGEDDEPAFTLPESDFGNEGEDDSFYEPEPDAECETEPLFSPESENVSVSEPFFIPESDPESDSDPFFVDSIESDDESAFPVESGPFPEMDSETGFSGIDQLFPLLETDGKTTLVGSWQPLEDADGYDVFFAAGGDSFDGVYRTLSAEKTRLTFKHLKKKSIYKMRVSAFILSAGQKSYICESDNVHCITGGSTKKHTNAAAIKISDHRLDLSVGDRKKISASLTGQDPQKDVLPCGNLLRYLSEDTSVAVVSKEGKVRAVAPGSCRVVVIAPNGIHSSVNVSVQESEETVAFRKKKYSIRVGKTINFKKKLKSEPDKEKGALKWKSSDKDVAEVNRKGIVTALKKGRITVRVKTKAGGYAKVRIRISPAKKPVVYPWESVGIGKKPAFGEKRSSFT